MEEEERFLFFISELCRYGGADETFKEDFTRRLLADPEIAQELFDYMKNGNFACKAKICGYTVIDIMIWQRDHFKARLDRDNSGTEQNGDRMVLLAFDTFLKMRSEPEKYVDRLKSETGTDYVGKF